jgi:hypothetical protein
MDNPILIHAQQINSQAFGDPRLVSELCGGGERGKGKAARARRVSQREKRRIEREGTCLVELVWRGFLATVRRFRLCATRQGKG